MITLNKLRRKPRRFQEFTGLSVTEFDRVLAEVTPPMSKRSTNAEIAASAPERSGEEVLIR